MKTFNSLTPHEIVKCDLSSISDYNKLIDPLADAVHEFDDANTAYRALGRSGLLSIFSEASPDSFATVENSRRDIESGIGVVVLHGTQVEVVDNQIAQLLSVTLGSVYGYPTKTDRKSEQIAWPIKYDPDTKLQRTFSQNIGEAAFHTDTQYYDKPDDSFGLFCLVSDAPGKGTNRMVRVEDIVHAMREQYGDASLAQLAKNFPCRVPSIFTFNAQDSEIEIIWAPILEGEGSRIRYRKDTIDKALQQPGVEIDADQMLALTQLEDVLHSLHPIDYHLQPGDGIIMNNKTLLHSRTTYDNQDRFLLRVRMREDATDGRV